MAKQKEPPDGTFEEKLKRLEEAVSALEGGGLTLEESLRSYEEGIAAYRGCRAILDAMRKRVELLSKDAEGNPILETFEGAPGGAER